MKSAPSWKTDQHGMVRGARIHDGNIIGVSIAVDEMLSFKVRRVNGEIVRFEFTGLRDFNAAIWNTPIILSFYIWKLDSAPVSAWTSLYAPISAVQERAARTMKQSPESFIAIVDTSYGGELAVVFDHMSIVEEGQPIP